MEAGELKAAFDQFNERGSELFMLAPSRSWLGIIDSWEILRVAPRPGGEPTFWLMFKQLGYDGGPQFTHVLHVVICKKTLDDLRFTDDDGREYSAEFIYSEDKVAAWDRWRETKRERAAEFADIDSALRAEYQEIANTW